MKNHLSQAEYHSHENVFISAKDAEGNAIDLFQMNKLGQSLLELFRKINPEPIADGEVKPGLMNHLSAYGVRVPFLTGMWVGEMSVANLITNAGIAAIAGRINGHGWLNAFTYIALGTGTTAANVADTTLEAELSTSGLARANGTVDRETDTVTNDTASITYTWTASGSAAVTESGVLNAASDGILLNRQVFSAVNLVNGNSFQVTHKFKAASA